MSRAQGRICQAGHVWTRCAGHGFRRVLFSAATSFFGSNSLSWCNSRGFDQSHVAFRTLARRGAYDLWMHGTGVSACGFLRVDGTADFCRHVPIKSGGGSREARQQKDADEVEIAFDEFHTSFSFVSMVSWFRLEWLRSFEGLPNRPSRSRGRVQTSSDTVQTQRGHT